MSWRNLRKPEGPRHTNKVRCPNLSKDSNIVILSKEGEIKRDDEEFVVTNIPK